MIHMKTTYVLYVRMKTNTHMGTVQHVGMRTRRGKKLLGDEEGLNEVMDT